MNIASWSLYRSSLVSYCLHFTRKETQPSSIPLQETTVICVSLAAFTFSEQNPESSSLHTFALEIPFPLPKPILFIGFGTAIQGLVFQYYIILCFFLDKTSSTRKRWKEVFNPLCLSSRFFSKGNNDKLYLYIGCHETPGISSPTHSKQKNG